MADEWALGADGCRTLGDDGCARLGCVTTDCAGTSGFVSPGPPKCACSSHSGTSLDYFDATVSSGTVECCLGTPGFTGYHNKGGGFSVSGRCVPSPAGT